MEIGDKTNLLLLFGCSLLMCLIASSDSSLQYDYYRQSCPEAQQIIKSTLRRIYNRNSNDAPAIHRLFFHDCFVQVRYCYCLILPHLTCYVFQLKIYGLLVSLILYVVVYDLLNMFHILFHLDRCYTISRFYKSSLS